MGGGRPLTILALDFDGTLVGCRDRQLAALERALGGQRIPDPGAFWAAKRSGASTAAALQGLGFSPADAAVTARRWVEVVEDDDLLALDSPVPCMDDALALADEAGVEVAIVTARRRAAAVRAQIATLGLRPAAGVHVVEPAGAAVAKACILGRLRPIGFAGDTESDAAAAASAGVLFAAVGCGQRDGPFLARHGVRVVHSDVLQAVQALLALRIS